MNEKVCGERSERLNETEGGKGGEEEEGRERGGGREGRRILTGHGRIRELV